MTKVVILKILRTGSWEQGFYVTLQLREEGNIHSNPADGQLPTNLDIPRYYQEWQEAYRQLLQTPRLDAPNEQETNVSWLEKCDHAAQELVKSLNGWLNSEEFRQIKESLLQNLDVDEPIVLIIQTDDFQLRRLPWHLWNFFEDYHQAAVVLSAANVKPFKTLFRFRRTLKILAIFGNSDGIDIQGDRKFLKNLPRTEKPLLMDQPCRQEIRDQLWDGSWDIFFFAGHSKTVGETGQISITANQSISLFELKYDLRQAIRKGLKLAIFNSCDGLGLAKELDKLGIPQVIVMREPIPDQVAQDFLKYFLNEFSQGESIYLAHRRARERLHDHWEYKIPGVTWLPVICQNPATKPLVWPSGRKNRKFILMASIVVLGLAFFISIFTFYLQKNFKNNIKKEKIVLYKNDEHRLKLNYPQTWQSHGNLEEERVFENGDFERFTPRGIDDSKKMPVVYIQENQYKTKVTLDDYSNDLHRKVINNHPRSDILERRVDLYLGNHKAKKLMYTESYGQTIIMEIWTVREKTVYVVKYIAPKNQYAKYLNDVDVIINSFRLE